MADDPELVVMVGGLEVLRSRELSDEFRRIVYQHGEMLRADPEAHAAVLEGDEGSLIRIAVAEETGV
jgi:hypothetical protein